MWKNKKTSVSLSLFSWLFFLASLVAASRVPAVGARLNKYNIFYLLKYVFSDYRYLLMVSIPILAVLAVLVPLGIYQQRVSGVSSEQMEKKSRESLQGLWLFLDFNRTILVLLGIVIFLLSFLGLDGTFLLDLVE